MTYPFAVELPSFDQLFGSSVHYAIEHPTGQHFEDDFPKFHRT